jgi:signal transduction histidine kinase
LLRRMGGTIHLDGSLGIGTTAIIELPIRK